MNISLIYDYKYDNIMHGLVINHYQNHQMILWLLIQWKFHIISHILWYWISINHQMNNHFIVFLHHIMWYFHYSQWYLEYYLFITRSYLWLELIFLHQWIIIHTYLWIDPIFSFHNSTRIIMIILWIVIIEWISYLFITRSYIFLPIILDIIL